MNVTGRKEEVMSACKLITRLLGMVAILWSAEAFAVQQQEITEVLGTSEVDADTVGISRPIATNYASEREDSEDLSTVSIQDGLIFSTADGSPVKVSAGRYALEITDAGHMALLPIEGGSSIVLGATFKPHDETVGGPTALLVADEDGAAHHLLLLLPDGGLAEAVGSRGGISTRGLANWLSPSKVKIATLQKQTLSLQQQLQLQKPGVQVATLTRPDLSIKKFNDSTKKAMVVNLGTADAFFSKAAPLIAGGSVQVPSGGKIGKGESVETLITQGIAWDCPDAIDSSVQYGRLQGWGYTEAMPTDEAGRTLLLVDPNNAVSEASETNNSYRLTRSNPHKTFRQPGLPDLQVVEATAYEDGNYLRWKYRVKNRGIGVAYVCGYYPWSEWSGNMLARVYIDGIQMGMNITFTSAPWIARSGVSKEMWHHTALSHQEFGVWTEGIQPGCHKGKVVADPYKKVQESNEGNNEREFQFATGGAICP
jgi:hypothetical protein